MSCSFQLTLVRHGQTLANKAQIIQGSSDVPLSEAGKEQARQLGAYFSKNGTTFTHVFSSDLSRAYDTAELVLGTNTDIVTDERLRERAFGVIEGKSIDFYRVAARETGFRELGSYTPEGGETVEEVYSRVKAFFLDLCDHLSSSAGSVENTRVLIVTHGGVIRQFMKIFSDDCTGDFKGSKMTMGSPNTAVTVFNIINRPDSGTKAEMVKLNDVSHLPNDEEPTFSPTKSSTAHSDAESSSLGGF